MCHAYKLYTVHIYRMRVCMPTHAQYTNVHSWHSVSQAISAYDYESHCKLPDPNVEQSNHNRHTVYPPID